MKMLQILKVKEKAGEVGIEIELEGYSLPSLGRDPVWRGVEDGSLRGESIEYVLRQPVKRGAVLKSLSRLKRHLVGSDVYDSHRAGVHVHINIQQMTFRELGTFISLYFTFESVLMDFCGEDRAGNLFCLRRRDAEGAISRLLMTLDTGSYSYLYSDEVRYSSINFKSLHTYGSLEFRGMRCDPSFKGIVTWTKLLLALKDKAIALNDPSLVPSLVSKHGARGALEEVFGKRLAKILVTCSKDFRANIMDDMRQSQLVSYHPKWI